MFNKILPTTYFFIGVCSILIFHFIIPVIQIIYMPWKLSGLVLIIVGIYLNLSADNNFKRNSTTVKPFQESNALIVNGVFKFTRNPMYLGMTLILLGESILLGTLSTFIIPVLFLLIMQYRFIKTEESMLKETFGEEYIKYQQCTRRWM